MRRSLKLILFDLVMPRQVSLSLCVPFLYLSDTDWRNGFRILVLGLSSSVLVFVGLASCKEKCWLYQLVRAPQASLLAWVSTALLCFTFVLGISTATTAVASDIDNAFSSDCKVTPRQVDSDITGWVAGCYLLGLCLSVKWTAFLAIDSFYQSLEFSLVSPDCKPGVSSSQIPTDDNK